jgi:hypothetical protein
MQDASEACQLVAPWHLLHKLVCGIPVCSGNHIGQRELHALLPGFCVAVLQPRCSAPALWNLHDAALEVLVVVSTTGEH